MQDTIDMCEEQILRRIDDLMEVDTEFLTKLYNGRAAKLTYAISIEDGQNLYVVFQVSR